KGMTRLLDVDEVNHRLLDQAVGRQGLSAADREGISDKIRDAAACFYNHQTSRGNIPWFETQFPKAINATGRDITQVHGSGAGTPQTLRLQGKAREVWQV